MSSIIFLFPHQDDEFGVFQTLQNYVNEGANVQCFYFTYSSTINLKRNNESIKVLGGIGVPEGNIHFMGEKLSIIDGKLPEKADSISEWLRSYLLEHQEVQAIYTPAWEGGHQDHDGLHAAVVNAAEKCKKLSLVRQFPLYNNTLIMGLLFRLLRPLPKNGPVERVLIPWKNRLRFFKYCLSYPSQYMTWIGLFPFVLIHYVCFGFESVQKIIPSRVQEKPHSGKLLYEKRNMYTWQKMKEHLSSFQDI